MYSCASSASTSTACTGSSVTIRNRQSPGGDDAADGKTDPEKLQYSFWYCSCSPSALYGKDPIAEAIAGYEPKELESDLTIETPEAEAPQGMEQADLSDMLGGQRVQTDAAVDPESFLRRSCIL